MRYIRPRLIILLSGNTDMRNQCFIIGRKQTWKDGSFSNASCFLATCKMGETCSPRLRTGSSRYETFLSLWITKRPERCKQLGVFTNLHCQFLSTETAQIPASVLLNFLGLLAFFSWCRRAACHFLLLEGQLTLHQVQTSCQISQRDSNSREPHKRVPRQNAVTNPNT